MAATNGNSKRAGVREVASLAGVSLGTVSNVLNSPERVDARTLWRVKAAMKELNYVPSRAAAQLRTNRSNLIGVVVPDVGNPYWSAVIRGIEQTVNEENLSIVVGSSRQDIHRELALLRGFESQGVDGLIIAPIDSGVNPFEKVHSPQPFGIVTIELEFPGLPAVMMDHHSGSYAMTDHLIKAGVKDILFINGPLTVPWCRQRLEGAQARIASGDRPDELSLRRITIPDLTVDFARSAMNSFLRSEKLPDVVYGSNDLVALGALISLRENGISVPDDILLAGYDDVEFATALSPSLTTVRQPSHLVGAEATRRLLHPSYFKGKATRYTPELIVRESTKIK